MPATTDRELLRVTEVARRLAISPATIYRAFARGELEGVRMGRTVRIYADSVERWIQHGG